MADKKENNTVNCNDCSFYSEEKKCCFREGGKLFGVKNLAGPLIDADHDCEQFVEVTYRVTPKGLLSLALDNAGVKISQSKFDQIWDDFADGMEKAGYVKHDEETNDED